MDSNLLLQQGIRAFGDFDYCDTHTREEVNEAEERLHHDFQLLISAGQYHQVEPADCLYLESEGSYPRNIRNSALGKVCKTVFHERQRNAGMNLVS